MLWMNGLNDLMVGMTRWIFHDTNFLALLWVWVIYAIWQVQYTRVVYSWLLRCFTVQHSKSSMSFVFDLVWRLLLRRRRVLCGDLLLEDGLS